MSCQRQTHFKFSVNREKNVAFCARKIQSKKNRSFLVSTKAELTFKVSISPVGHRWVHYFFPFILNFQSVKDK